MPDFAAAAARHCRDADFLHTDNRFASADHLAGIAAECGLKAIILHFLGGRLTPAGVPAAVVGRRLTEYRLHVDRLRIGPSTIDTRTATPSTQPAPRIISMWQRKL